MDKLNQKQTKFDQKDKHFSKIFSLFGQKMINLGMSGTNKSSLFGGLSNKVSPVEMVKPSLKEPNGNKRLVMGNTFSISSN